MNNTCTRLVGVLSLALIGLPWSAVAAPRIQFDRVVYDFGSTSRVTVVSGLFRFKNVGDGLLKVEPPRPSCGCTVAELKPDKLLPGESGELPFTLHLGQSKALFDKRIVVRSNDPDSPEVTLSIKADYTPLYDVNPLTLAPKLAYGVNEAIESATITRTDGAPIQLSKLVASQPWITATLEPEGTNKTMAKMRVAIQRQGPPRRFTEFVHVYAAGDTNTPVSNIYLYGQFVGEISLTHESLYWSLNPLSKASATPAEAMLTRRVTIRSTNGKPIELKNPRSTLDNVKLELVSKEGGKVYELVARLDQAPASTVSGSVSFETSVKSQAVIDLPVIVHVSKP